MKFTKLLVGIVSAAMLMGSSLIAQDAPAAEEAKFVTPWTSLKLEYANRYFSKGMIYTPDDMMFGAATVGLSTEKYGELYFGIWFARDLSDYYEDAGLVDDTEETDYYVGYDYTIQNVPGLDKVNVDLSYTFFDYPHCLKEYWGEPVNEHEWALNVKAVGDYAVKPGIMFAGNVEDEKFYLKTYADYSYNFKNVCESLANLTFDTNAAVYFGFSRYNGGVKGKGNDNYKDAFSDFTLCSDLMYKLNDNFSVGPFLYLGWALDHDVRRVRKASPDQSSFNSTWGLRLNANF